MLRNLLKYEFKAMGRIMIPLYIAWMIFSVIFGVFANIMDGNGTMVVGVIAIILYVVVTVAVTLMTIILIIQRFYKNLLGNEGYLMFALPVKTSTHLANKTISAAIWIVLGCIMGAISAFIICLITGSPADVFASIGKELNYVVGSMGMGNMVIVIIETIILALMCCGESALKVYASIAIGHQFNNNRVLGSIGAYIGLGIIEVLIINLISVINNKFNLDESLIRSLYHSSDMTIWHTGCGIMFIAVAVAFAIYWFITWKLMDKRLNLQ